MDLPKLSRTAMKVSPAVAPTPLKLRNERDKLDVATARCQALANELDSIVDRAEATYHLDSYSNVMRRLVG